MSLSYKNQKCAVCSAYLFDEDDIVYCPVCGAPHHRECYNNIGKCGFDHLHGTDMQYRKEDAPEAEPEIQDSKPALSSDKVCLGCGMNLERGARYCNNCGMPANIDPKVSGAPFVLGAFENTAPIKDDTPIDEGVTVKDAAKIVRTNAFRYIPKFVKLGAQNKNSWNWAAFLLPHGWFAFRKMYKESVIVSLLSIVSVILNFPLNLAIANLPLANENIRNYLELAEYYASFANEIGGLPILLSFIGLVMGLAVRIISGIYGDYIYKQRVVASANLIKEAEEKEALSEKLSGTSFLGFFIAVLAVEFIPSLLSMLLL